MPDEKLTTMYFLGTGQILLHQNSKKKKKNEGDLEMIIHCNKFVAKGLDYAPFTYFTFSNI